MSEELHKTITIKRDGITITVSFPREGTTTPTMIGAVTLIRGWMEILMQNIILMGNFTGTISVMPTRDKLEKMFIEKFSGEEESL